MHHQPGLPKPGDIVVNRDLGVGHVVRIEGTGPYAAVVAGFGPFIVRIPLAYASLERL